MDCEYAGPGHPGPWLHRYMVAYITASIELTTLERSRHFAYIRAVCAILSRAGTDAKLRFPTTHSLIQTWQRRHIHAKNLHSRCVVRPWTYQKRRHRRSLSVFLSVEADRGTEPVTSRNWNRKSFERHLAQYQAYVEGGAYREHLKLTAPLLVLNVVPDEARIDLMRRQTERQLGGCTYQLFQAFPAFTPPWQPPEPNHALVTGAWLRAGLPAFEIDAA